MLRGRHRADPAGGRDNRQSLPPDFRPLPPL